MPLMKATTSKLWKSKEQPANEVVQELAKSLSVDALVATLLVQRGISTYDEARMFFRPSLEELHDPFLMKDMDKAVQRILDALEEDQKILVYGDYDVDGTTAVALVYSFLKEIHKNVDYYIPDRYAEGYGISDQGVDYAIEGSFALVIALDCGIKAVEKIARAKENGVDFIVCDHHRPGNILPPAVAILDPKQDDCSYPFNELCGCGIGFKLVQALVAELDYDTETLTRNLDLCAISACSDIVPLLGENRILTWHGLVQINENPRVGIKSMLALAKMAKEISVNELVFTIGPRINAAGRMHTGRKAVELLISNDPQSAGLVGQDIQLNNVERQRLDKEITEEALEMIAGDKNTAAAKSTVVFKEDWHKGVVGIVASRLIERHFRPTIVLTQSNGMVSGSARSVPGFDVYNAIEQCSDLLEQFGGHMYAAGLTMKRENVGRFQRKFEEVVAGSITPEMLIPAIDISAELSFDQITPKFIRILKQFEPFGPQNMKPIFVSRGVRDTGNSRIVGTDHLKLELEQEKYPGIIFGGIAFGQADKLELIRNGQSFDLAYVLEENEWNGNVSIQLNVKDMGG